MASEVTFPGQTGNANSDNVEVKTGGADSSSNTQPGATPGSSVLTPSSATTDPIIARSNLYNPLHNYRSWNYVFTIAAVEPASLKDSSYQDSALKYVILKSSGKGSTTISNSVNTPDTPADPNVNDLITQFNRESPGRFDLFIDNVTIDSMITASEEASMSLPTKLSFDVIEPYSMGGFLEALAVASRAVGQLSYAAAPFVLKMEFFGYSDKSTGPDDKPVLIPETTRYYPFLFTKVEVEASDRGTLYKCVGCPTNEKGFGESNNVKSDIKMKGTTVGEVLRGMIQSINDAVVDEAKKNKGANTTNYDTYEIYFAPEDTGQKIITNGPNRTPEDTSIPNAKINDELRGNPNYSFPDPGSPAPGTSGYQGQPSTGDSTPTAKYDPNAGAINFASGSQIHEIISAVIRDSKFTKDLLAVELPKVKADTSGNGQVTYFMVRLETDFLDKNFDPQTMAKNMNYRYVVQPYKMHYTRIPGEQLGVANWEGVQKQIKRTYDYLYTGKNKDVINFNLKFNHLYFQAIPPATGNKSNNETTKTAGSPDTPQVTAPVGDPKSVADKEGKPTAPIKSASASSATTPQGGTGQPGQSTPYHAIAQSMHEAVLKSVDLNICDLEIYGDPYYLVTGGIGNQTHQSKDKGITSNGELPLYSGECYVNVNFKTPIDIDPLAKGGLMRFEANLLPFSGIYRVNTVNSTLSQGVFKQKLKLVRMPGQLTEAKKVNTDGGFTSTPLPGQQQVKDVAPAGVQTAGTRPNDFSLTGLLARGLPSPGLPGVLSNFTGAAGGALGGLSIGSVTGALNAVAGAGGTVQNIVGQVKTIAPQFGSQIGNSLGGVNALASGIRLATSGISNLIGGTANAAKMISSSNIVGSIPGLGSANNTANLASGVASQVSNLGGSVQGLGANALASAQSLGSSVANNVSGIGSQVASLTGGTPSDPTALAASLGIDPTQLAGLDPATASKVTAQLQTIAQDVPANVDINQVKDQGIVLAYVNQNTINNIPPTQPQTESPPAYDNQQDIQAIIAGGGSVANLPGASLVPGIGSSNLFANLMGQSTGGLSSLTGGLDTSSITDKLSSAQGQLNSLVAGATGVSGDITSGALSSAKAGLGSVESNIASIQNQVQSGVPSNLSQSVTSQFGSLQSASPLANLVASTNDSSSDPSLSGDWSV